MPKKVNKLTSLSDYASHRGVSRAAVTKAVQEGRLRRCLVEQGGRTWISSVAAADEEWADNTRSSARVLERIEQSGVPPLAVSEARLAAARAALAYLDLAERKGELIDAKEAAEKFVEAVVVAKTKLLGLAASVRRRLPHLSTSDVGVIDDLVREALEDLADGEDDGAVDDEERSE